MSGLGFRKTGFGFRDTIGFPRAAVVLNYDEYLASLAPEVWWKLDDPVGSTTASDSSGNGYTGTFTGTVTFGEAAPPMGGTSASAATSSYVANTSVVGAGAGAFSLVAWGSPTQVSTRIDILNFGNSDVAGDGGYLYVESGVVHCDLALVAGPSGGTVTVGAWQMFAVVCSATGDMTIYLNGTEVGSQTGMTHTIQAGAAILGNPAQPNYNSWTGDGAQGAVFSAALTASEIATLYSKATA